MRSKIFTFLFFFIVFFQNNSQAQFQQLTENDACLAECLPLSGILKVRNPFADGVSQNLNLPCGSGTSEDNPFYWRFVPKTSKMVFKLSTGNCESNTPSQLAVFKGESCNDILEPIGCISCKLSDSLVVNLEPNKTYYLHLDGCAEGVCDNTITYNGSSLATFDPYATAQVTNIYSHSACVNDSTEFNMPFFVGNTVANWTVSPPNLGIIKGGSKTTVEIVWKKAGNAEVCNNYTYTNCYTGLKNTHKYCFNAKIGVKTDTATTYPKQNWVMKGLGAVEGNLEPMATNPNKFYVANGILYKTDNFGKSYVQQKLNFPISKIYTTSDSLKLFATADNSVYSTVDGGKNWSLISFGNYSTIRKFVVGDNNTWLLMVDGGKIYYHFSNFTIQQIVNSPIADVKNIHFANGSFYLFGNNYKKIASTSNFAFYNVKDISTNDFINSWFNEEFVFASKNTIPLRAYTNNNSSGKIFSLNYNPTGTNSWDSIAILPGYLELAACPIDPDLLYVARVTPDKKFEFYKYTHSQKKMNLVFQSSANNSNFSAAYFGLGGLVDWRYVTYIRIRTHQTDVNRLYMQLNFNYFTSSPQFTTFSAFYTSVDGGKSWQQKYVTEKTENPANQAVKQENKYENTGVSSMNHSDPLFIDYNMIYQDNHVSDDNGKSWKSLYDKNKGILSIKNLQKQKNANRYFGIAEVNDFVKIRNYLAYSDDNCKTWDTLPSFGNEILEMKLNPKYPKMMLFCNNTQVFVIKNIDLLEKSTFVLIDSKGSANSISKINFGVDSTVIIQKYDYSYISRNHVEYRRIIPKISKAIAHDWSDTTGNSYYIAVYNSNQYWESGIYFTNDNGKTFNFIKSVEDTYEISNIALNPYNAKQMAITYYYKGVEITDDITADCIAWKKVVDIPNARLINAIFNPFIPNELWITTNNGNFVAQLPSAKLAIKAVAQNTANCTTKKVALSVNANQLNCTYLWKGANNFTATTQSVDVFPMQNNEKYYVTVTTQSGEKAVDSVSVFSDFTQPTLTLSASPSGKVCAGQKVAITATSNAKEFLWSNLSTDKSITITATKSGFYNLLATAVNGCSKAEKIEVLVSDSLKNVQKILFITPPNKTVIVPLLPIVQTLNPSVKSVTPSQVAIKEQEGKYTKKINYKDENGCTGEVEIIAIVFKKIKKGNKSAPDNISENDILIFDEEIDLKGEFLVYPNPSDGIFKVYFESMNDDYSLEVFNQEGRLIKQIKNDNMLDLTGEAKGVYFLKVVAKSDVFVKNIILN